MTKFHEQKAKEFNTMILKEMQQVYAGLDKTLLKLYARRVREFRSMSPEQIRRLHPDDQKMIKMDIRSKVPKSVRAMHKALAIWYLGMLSAKELGRYGLSPGRRRKNSKWTMFGKK